MSRILQILLRTGYGRARHDGDNFMGSQKMKRKIAILLVIGMQANLAFSYEWHEYNGNFYSLTNFSSTWWSCEYEARDAGGHLVTVNDLTENSWLVSTFGGSQHYWIGLYQPPGTGEPGDGWRWINNEPFVWANWIAGQPNNSAGSIPPLEEDYCHMNHGSPGKWNDVWTDDPYYGIYTNYGIIEIEIGAPPSNDYFNGDQGGSSGTSNDPVNTATGNFFHSEEDLSITTRSIPIEFVRHYNSKSTSDGPLGVGWTHSYNIKLTDTGNLISVRWGDSKTDYWNPDGAGGYVPNTVGLYDKLENNGGYWVLTKKNLDVYTFDQDGKLHTITDKNGNAVTLSYNYSPVPDYVTEITDSAGRTLSLGYNADNLLDNITDFATPSRTVQFHYTDGRLTQIVDVMGSTIDYTYDANGYLNVINDQRSVNIVTNVYDANGRVVQQSDGNSNITGFAYDTPFSDQTSITDPNGGVTIHIHYSGYKLLQSIQNPLGGTIYYDYDSNANRISITDRNGNITQFAYDLRGNVTSTTESNDVTDPYDGGVTTVEYNDVNFPDLPTKKIDALGNVTTWEYDSKGNVSRQVDPNGFTMLWTYNNFGRKLTEQDERGDITQYVYNGDGMLTEIIDPNNNHAWFGYDALWRLTHITDGRAGSFGDPARTTVTAYNNADRIISITGLVTSESYQYDNVGNRTHVTNRRGHTTMYQYDNNNNLIKVQMPAPGGQTQYSYDTLNHKISVTDPNGNITHFEYDDAGRMTRVINAEGNETVYTYDAQGNVLTVTDGAGVKVSYEYDFLNRKVHQYDLLGNHWHWQYDKLGKMTQYADALGHATNYNYDCLSRLISVTDAANKTTRYQYDAVGNLIDVNDAAGIIVSRKFYDKANKLIRQEDAHGNAYEYAYDGAGNRISVKDANNQIATMVYDDENMLIEVHYPDSTVSYSYDGNGNLVSMTDSTGTSAYVYDAFDRLISSTDSFGKTVQYGYDVTGNRTSITYPADSENPARMVNYSYDKANRMDKITDWAGRTWDYSVDGAGRITQLVYPNGVKELRSYDTAGRLSSLAYKKSDDTTLMSYAYTRDGQGSPKNISETGTLPANPKLPIKIGYTYDADNRLLETNQPASYNYDNNGNMISRTVSGVTTTFSYNFENRLISQTSAGSTIQHVYDGRGNRIARIDNGTATRYVLDNGRDMSHVLCETDGSGDITAYYIHGPLIAGRIGADGSVRYYHSDHIGNIVALTDDSQNITDKYAYTPFGVPAGKQVSTANQFTFVGGLGVMAEDDGLYFMRARFYDAETGRFLGKDTVEGSLMQPMSLYKYAYCFNNTLVHIDPTGLQSEEDLYSSAQGAALNYGDALAVKAKIIGRVLPQYKQAADIAEETWKAGSEQAREDQQKNENTAVIGKKEKTGFWDWLISIFSKGTVTGNVIYGYDSYGTESYHWEYNVPDVPETNVQYYYIRLK
jgi:RHS repeat-associated protein